MEVVALLLGWLLIGDFSFADALYYTRGQIPSLQCTQYVFCSERDRDRWLEKRRIYKILLALKKEALVKIDSSISLFTVGRWRDYLCYEYQSAAFLMNDESERWQIACLWNGNDVNGTCAPAPPINKPVAYIEPVKWKQMLRKFRESIKCSPRAIWEAERAQELYICTERCVHGGIGYMSVLLLSAILMISITLICFRG